MLGQFHGQEILKTPIKTGATTIALPAGSIMRVGGKGVNLASTALICNTSVVGLGGLDVGSLAASSLYYLYVVISGINVGLVASLSEIAPVGFLSSRVIGAFYSSNVPDVGGVATSLFPLKVFGVEFAGSISNLGSVGDAKFKFSRDDNFMFIDFALTVGTPAGGTVELTLPMSLNVDTQYYNAVAAQWPVGKLSRNIASTQNDYLIFLDISIPTKLRFGRTQDAGAGPFAARSGTEFATSDRMSSYGLKVAILEWRNE